MNLKDFLPKKAAKDASSLAEKKAFLEAMNNFSKLGESIYRNERFIEDVEAIGELTEKAQKFTLKETENWFDGVTVSRHMKRLQEAQAVFNKSANEIKSLQTRMEAAYEDIAEVLKKYYNI
jgi:hypothetical protein